MPICVFRVWVCASVRWMTWYWILTRVCQQLNRFLWVLILIQYTECSVLFMCPHHIACTMKWYTQHKERICQWNIRLYFAFYSLLAALFNRAERHKESRAKLNQIRIRCIACANKPQFVGLSFCADTHIHSGSKYHKVVIESHDFVWYNLFCGLFALIPI